MISSCRTGAIEPLSELFVPLKESYRVCNQVFSQKMVYVRLCVTGSEQESPDPVLLTAKDQDSVLSKARFFLLK